MVGDFVGPDVGLLLGEFVGLLEGLPVGAAVGDTEGGTDGVIVGYMVSWHVMFTLTLWRFPALSRRLTDSQFWGVPASSPFGRRASLVPTFAD